MTFATVMKQLYWQINGARLKRLSGLTTLIDTPQKLEDFSSNVSRRMNEAVFFWDDSLFQITPDGVMSARTVDGITFQQFRKWQGETLGKISNANGNKLGFYDPQVQRVLIHLDKITR